MTLAAQARKCGTAGSSSSFPKARAPPVGAPPHYKAGVAQIYVDCGVPCLPVALNSGLFWPRRTFMRYPGTLVVEFLDPLPPGLPRDEFHRRVSAPRSRRRPTASLTPRASSRRNCSAGCRIRRGEGVAHDPESGYRLSDASRLPTTTCCSRSLKAIDPIGVEAPACVISAALKTYSSTSSVCRTVDVFRRSCSRRVRGERSAG